MLPYRDLLGREGERTRCSPPVRPCVVFMSCPVCQAPPGPATAYPLTAPFILQSQCYWVLGFIHDVDMPPVESLKTYSSQSLYLFPVTYEEQEVGKTKEQPLPGRLGRRNRDVCCPV
ncbi:hypothetical protein L798_02244 [Zootermopsis nevadensis]|uniref:Uncharacterized protein n=1 Tax=Zootermopsis nevadensis TaxID=136037 RepID=A0A067QUI8_ZOONE|nr:hypothetical protein L798_02244 [Zootermopsis nevadensis]